MINTEFSSKLAEEIVKSWAKSGSNYILVAPPLSNGRSLLRRICDGSIISSLYQPEDYAKYSIAELDTNSFKDDVTFAKKVLLDWKVPIPKFGLLDDAVSLLNYGTEIIIEKRHRPIIVIHRFHEALTKLGEDIGTALRNLEHDYNLNTVVELPVSIACLRQRWESSLRGSPPFLASDWGQGHSVKFLKGLNRQEIEDLLPENKNKSEMAKKIYALTAGLPGLVEKLLVPAESKNPEGLGNYAKSQANSLCSRLVEWIDRPNDDFFKRLLIRTAVQSKSEEITRINDHDWKDLFKENEPSFGFQMLVWACNSEISRESNSWYVQQLRICFAKGAADDFDVLLDALEINQSKSGQEKRVLAMIKRFSDSLNPFEPDWASARKVINDCREIGLDSTCEAIEYLDSYFKEWEVLCENMNSFKIASEKTGLRLEQFSLEKNNQIVNFSLIEFLEIRLDFAKENFTPYVAMKAVVELPEIMLQIYSYINCEVCFWDFDGGKIKEAEEISALIKMNFKMPRKNATLGFFEMLCLIFFRMQSINASERLFDSYDQFVEIQKIYDERKRQVHSTALVEHAEWIKYEAFCRGWLQKVKKTAGLPNSKKLKTPATVFDELLSRMI